MQRVEFSSYFSKSWLARPIVLGVLAGLSMSLPAQASAQQQGDLMVRGGVTLVSPDESSKVLTTQATGPLARTGVSVDNNAQLGLNVLYMYSNNIALELLAATPFKHDIAVYGLGQYGFTTTDLGSTKHLPPTISAVYFFGDSSAKLRPYVGAGLNYTTFFSEKLSQQARTELAAARLKLDDSFGLALQAGFDFKLDNNWLLNASVRRIDIKTDASMQSALGKVMTKVDLAPWVYTLSVGYRY
jgi:outer membrane protein